MNYIIFDLEWNGSYSKKLEMNINEIIEFGAVKLDENLNQTAQFTALIRPEISKYLCSSVRNLTSLKYDVLKKNGMPFTYVYRQFARFCKNSVVMSWSDSDIVSLLSNVEYHFNQNRLLFLEKYADLQLYCEDMLGHVSKNSLGLQTAAEMLELDISEIPQHRAYGDSMITAMCLRKLYHQGALQSYIQNAKKTEFYDSLHSHTVFIADLNHPLIDKRTMFFNCNVCGARMSETGTWKEQSHCFFNDFECPVCGNHFRGRIQYKQKDTSVTYHKKILKIPAA